MHQATTLDELLVALRVLGSSQGWRRPAQLPPADVLSLAVRAGVMFDGPRADGLLGDTIGRTGVLPWWSARLAYLIALGNFAFIPSIYFSTRAASFYSASGWGNTAATASLISYWVLAAGVVLVRRGSSDVQRRPLNV